MQEVTYTRVLAFIRERPGTDDPSQVTECGECGFRWNDSLSTSLTPAPPGRCPAEYNHSGYGSTLAVDPGSKV